MSEPSDEEVRKAKERLDQYRKLKELALTELCSAKNLRRDLRKKLSDLQEQSMNKVQENKLHQITHNK